MKRNECSAEDWQDLQMNILDHVSDSVIVTDLDLRVIYWNKGAEELFGYTEKEMLGKSPALLYPNLDAEELAKDLEEIKKGNPFKGLWEGVRKDGKRVWINIKTDLFRAKDGTIKGFIGVSSDVTELVTAQNESSWLLHQLEERVKELQLLYDVKELFDQESRASEEVLQDIVGRIPYAWQFPDLACARLKYDGKEFLSRGFHASSCNQKGTFSTMSGDKGEIEVFYSKEKPFLVEEQALLNQLCGKVGDWLDRRQLLKELQSSQASYKSLFEESPMPKILFDPDSLAIIKANQKVVELYGYSEEELIGKKINDFRAKRSDHEVQDNVERIKKQENSPIFAQHSTKEGELIDVEIHSNALLYQGRKCILSIIRDVTELKKLQERVEREKVERQQEVSKAIIQAQEAERQEIGRELHDNINQLLAATAINLDAEKNYSGGKTLFLDNSINYLNKAIEELRNISHRMLQHEDRTLKEYIESALRSMDPENQKKSFLICENMDGVMLAEDLTINLYRMVQEQLKNIATYARANKIEVAVHRLADQIHMTIKDDGVGFDPEQVKYGIGIKNIRDRAELYGGTFQLDSKEGKGTTISVKVPIQQESKKKESPGSGPT